MWVDALRMLTLIGTGLVAGVLFCVALSVMPALLLMAPPRYVDTHRLLGRNFDPTMPILTLTSALADLALAVLTTGAARLLAVAAAALLVGVSVVSHLCNVPINRRVKGVDPDRLPTQWADPRPLWTRWHLVRTALSVLALGATAASAVYA